MSKVTSAYSPKDAKEIKKIYDLPIIQRKPKLEAIAKRLGKQYGSIYQKMLYMNGHYATGRKSGPRSKNTRKDIKVSAPKQEPTSITGRKVEIKGIKSISFSEGSLIFTF